MLTIHPLDYAKSLLKRGSSKNNSIKIHAQVAYREQLKEAYDYEIKQNNIGKNENATFDIFFDPRLNGLLEKMSRKGFSLGDRFYLRQCIKTGNDDEYVKVSPVKLADPWKVTLRGRSIQRYSIIENNLFLKYGPWLARNWKNVSFYETQKIIVRETGSRIIATIDMKNRYILSSLYGLYAKSPAEPVSLFFLLGILNSKLATFYLKKTALDLSRGAFTKMRTNQLARLPIYQCDPQNKQDAVLIKAVEDNARKILKLCEEQNKAHDTIDGNLFRRQFEFYDKQIEHLVYQLYGLTDEEIRIVEEATAPAKS